jgi:hypothetical protein
MFFDQVSWFTSWYSLCLAVDRLNVTMGIPVFGDCSQTAVLWYREAEEKPSENIFVFVLIINA